MAAFPRPFRWLVVGLSASFPAVGACHLDEVRSVAVFVGLAALILGLLLWIAVMMSGVATLVFLYCAWRDARRPLGELGDTQGSGL